MTKKDIHETWNLLTVKVDELYKADVITKEDRREFDSLMDKVATNSILPKFNSAPHSEG